MNAAGALIELVIDQLAPDALQRLAGRASSRFDEARAPATLAVEASIDGATRPLGELHRQLADRYAGDGLELLNACRVDELSAMAQRLGLSIELASPPPRWPGRKQVVRGRAGQLRLAVWRALHAAGFAAVAPAALASLDVSLIGERLVACAPARGLSPPAAAWPRPLPPPAAPEPPDGEPECLDTLLDAAGRALGVRLGCRGRDGKGAWGQRAAELLGVIDRGDREPDWRGDVEIKTVAVARSVSGAWRVVEDPAISTVGAAPIAKLQRVLWLCRADAGDGDATLVSWYLLDWDEVVAQLVQRYLHVRPKGPRGSAGRGYYLHKRFFADAGLLASLNGPSGNGPPGLL